MSARATKKETPPKVDEAVLAAAMDAVETDEMLIANPVITTSTGARIRVKRIPDYLAQRVWNQFEEPTPPLVEINEEGRTWKEENPDDPDFKRALRDHQHALSEAYIRLSLLRGVTVEALPEGVPAYEDDKEWLEEYETLGLAVPQAGSSRRLEWLRYRVLPNNTDVAAVQRLQNALSGVTEKDVEAAMATFRNNGG